MAPVTSGKLKLYVRSVKCLTHPRRQYTGMGHQITIQLMTGMGQPGVLRSDIGMDGQSLVQIIMIACGFGTRWFGAIQHAMV